MTRVIMWSVGGVVGGLVLIIAVAFGAVAGFGSGGGQGCGPSTGTPAEGLTAEQQQNAAIIVHTGQTLKVPAYGWIIAVATALQESNLISLGDLGDRNDHDSIGLFQQRPSMGWGTVEQLRDPAYASTKFYQKLVEVPDWEHLRLTVAAQRVQVSGFPEAYAKHEGRARAIVGALGGSCGAVSASGWMAPVVAPIVSDFRTPERPTHNGADLGAARGATIHAAAAGIVVTAVCNIDNANYGPETSPAPCDVDGSPDVGGCGWYVEIRHTVVRGPTERAEIVSRYCHMLVRPMVRVGQVVNAGTPIGIVGTSGNSSGPHLHLEIHLGHDADGSNAVSPVEFFRAQGVALGSGKG